MELFSSAFFPAVMRVIESNIPVLATIPIPRNGRDIPGGTLLSSFATLQRLLINIHSVRCAVAGVWCWFVVREKYYWLAGGCWLVLVCGPFGCSKCGWLGWASGWFYRTHWFSLSRLGSWLGGQKVGGMYPTGRRAGVCPSRSAGRGLPNSCAVSRSCASPSQRFLAHPNRPLVWDKNIVAQSLA